jgi:hypothetical protein
VKKLKQARRALRDAATMVESAASLIEKVAEEHGGNEACNAGSLLDVALQRIDLARDELKGVEKKRPEPMRVGGSKRRKVG